MKSISPLATIFAIALVIASASAGSILPVSASTSVQSSISAFLSCPSSLSFGAQASGSPCSSGSFKGVYNGVSQTVGTSQNSVFYLVSSVSGGVKVNYSLADLTTSKSLIRWVGFGSILGGSCSSPSVILPATTGSGSSYVINTGAVVNSGDTLKASVNITFQYTNTPQLCSGGASATLISIGTTANTGSSQPILTTTLTSGRAHQSMLLGFNGVAESYVNNGGVSLTALVFGVLKDSGGRTIDILSTSITMSPGGNVTAFLALKTYPSGSYTMTVFATSSQLAPASMSLSASVIV